eukprot:Skav225825  [mRNA]  locus=scaffold2516:14315:17246:- [translate_table: standard]
MSTLRSKLFSPGDAKSRVDESDLKQPYLDPVLKHDKKQYADFVSRLHQANLVEYRLEARECVGVFFVWKKSGRQRMVIDARRANLWFGRPQKVSLATGSAFSRIQVDSGPPIHVGGVDISDAFYRIALPSEFRDLFALPGLSAKALRLTELDGVPIDPKQMLFPCFRAIPMGWSHALWICQQCHEVVTDSLKHIPSSLRFSDMRPLISPLVNRCIRSRSVMLVRSPKAGDVKPVNSMRRSAMVSGNQTGHARVMTGGKQNAKNKKQMKAQTRVKKHGPATKVTVGNVGSSTFLETQHVTHSRSKSYADAWDAFQKYVKANHLPIKTLIQLDAAGAWWIDQLYYQGEDIAAAMTFMAAARNNRVDVTKTSVLTRSTRALKGFRKMAPGQSRVPLPFPMLAKMVLWIAVNTGELMVCLWLLMTWHLVGRPGEALKLQWKHLVCPNKINPSWSAVTSPSSEVEGMQQPSKIGEMDESVTLDMEFLRWMGPLLAKLKQMNLPNDFVFTFPLSKGNKLFNMAVDELGFRQYGIQCPYQIRHGAASTELWPPHKPLEDVMKKGRWRTLVSVRRYEQGGRLAQVFGSLSGNEQTSCLKAENDLAKYLLHSFGCKTPRKLPCSWNCLPVKRAFPEPSDV